MNTCSGCGAEIIWKYTEHGKRMPLNPEPIHRDEAITPGLYRIEGELCHTAAPMFDRPGTVYHMNHWATCPEADAFRKTKGAR